MKTYERHHYVFVPYGPKASVGNFYLAPFYYQLMYWLYLLTHQDLSMLVATIALESLTPVLLFLILKKVFPVPAALAGSLVYGVSYQVTVFGTTAWNPNLIPLLAAVTLYAGLKLVDRSASDWWIVAATTAVVIAFHFHFQGAVLAPFVLGLIGIYLYHRRRLLPLLSSVIVCLLTFLPYILTEVRYDFPNTKQIITFVTQDHPRIYDRISKPAFVTTFVPAFIGRTILGRNIPNLEIGQILWFGGLASLAYTLWKRRTTNTVVIVGYLGLALIMLRVYKGDKLDFYMGTLYLLPALLLGSMASVTIRGAMIIAVICSVFSGYYLGKQTGFDEHAHLTEACRELSSIKVPFQPLVYADDLLQQVAFCKLSYSLKFDTQSTVVVDVCEVNRDCADPLLPACTTHKQNFSRLFKQTAGYILTSQLTSDPFVSTVGRSNVPISTNNIAWPLFKSQLLPNNSYPEWMTEFAAERVLY